MAAELPDDLESWPQSPFEILDVSWESDERTLKRHYAAHLKRFTPELKPLHFRRLRDAYEFVRTQFRYRAERANTEEIAKTQTEVAPPAGDHDLGDSSSPSDDPQSSERIPFPPDPLASWDQWMRAGEFAIAYAELRAAEEQKPHDAAYCVRLYWLLCVIPALDASRSPVDWLFRGLARPGALDWTQAQLFAREVAREPQLVESPVYRRLLERANPDDHLRLLEWRWSALLRRDQERHVRDDVERALRKFSDSPDVLTARLYLQAIEILIWSRDRALNETLVDEYADRLETLSASLVGDQEMFDRVDWLRAVVPGWRKLHDYPRVPAEIVALLRKTSLPGPADYDWEIHQFLVHTHAQAFIALNVLDDIMTIGGPAITLFDNVLSQVSYPRYVQHDEADLALLGRMAQAWYQRVDLRVWTEFRRHTLRFCVRHRIAPRDLIRLPGFSLEDAYGINDPSESLDRDLPLRYLYNLMIAAEG